MGLCYKNVSNKMYVALYNDVDSAILLFTAQYCELTKEKSDLSCLKLSSYTSVVRPKKLDL